MSTDNEDMLLRADMAPPQNGSAAALEEFDGRVSSVFEDFKDLFGPPVQRHYIQNSQGVVRLEKVVERGTGDFESLLSLVFSCEADLVCVTPGERLLPGGDLDHNYLDLMLRSLEQHRFVPLFFDEDDRPYTGVRFADYCRGQHSPAECTWYWRFFSYL